jgi:hypothetical protein
MCNVNDAGVQSFDSNCAACTIAGLLDLRYSAVVRELTSCGALKEAQKNSPSAPPLALDEESSAIYVKNHANLSDIEKFEKLVPAEKQLMAMATLMKKRGYSVKLVGGPGGQEKFNKHNARPASELVAAMKGFRPGTLFAVLVGENKVMGKSFGELHTHWLAARRKEDGEVEFTDYQTDVHDENVLTYAKRKKYSNVGKPSVSDTPMRPFAEPLGADDRAMAVAFIPAAKK